MPDIKPEYNPCPVPGKKYQDYLLERSHSSRNASNPAYSKIIARFLVICSTMLITIISEIFMSTLVKSQDFDRDEKNKQDLHPTNSHKCECPFWVQMSYDINNHSLLRTYNRFSVPKTEKITQMAHWTPHTEGS